MSKYELKIGDKVLASNGLFEGCTLGSVSKITKRFFSVVYISSNGVIVTCKYDLQSDLKTLHLRIKS